MFADLIDGFWLPLAVPVLPDALALSFQLRTSEHECPEYRCYRPFCP
jgi:hypothetical protein